MPKNSFYFELTYNSRQVGLEHPRFSLELVGCGVRSSARSLEVCFDCTELANYSDNLFIMKMSWVWYTTDLQVTYIQVVLLTLYLKTLYYNYWDFFIQTKIFFKKKEKNGINDHTFIITQVAIK